MKRKSKNSKKSKKTLNESNDAQEKEYQSDASTEINAAKNASQVSEVAAKTSLKRTSSTKGRGRPKKLREEPEKSASEEDDNAEADDAQYEVEKVLDEKSVRGVRHYLIRWKGYEPESDTWEPEDTLNCTKLIADFEAKKVQKGGASPKKSPERRSRGRPSKGMSNGRNENTENQEWDENANFEVERIVDVYFKRDGSREFLVSWKGYPTSQNSWEPEENMDCKDLIKKYMEKVDRARQVDIRELRVNRVQTDRLTLMSGSSGRRLSKRQGGQQKVHYFDTDD